MKVALERIPESQARLTVELEQAEIELHRQKSYRKLSQRAVVPGFRKGKAPRHILERLLGPTALLEEGLETLLAESTYEAIRQEGLDVVGQPQIADIDMDGAAPRLSWKATVPLRPSVDLGDYRAIRVPAEEAKATEEQVQQRLESIRLQATPFEPLDRPAEIGDMLTLDVVAVAHDVPMPVEGQEGVTAPGDLTFMDERSWNFRLVAGTLFPVPGFDEQAKGMVKEETRQFSLTPSEDFAIRDIAGKRCDFTVKLLEVKAQSLPEMDDEWAKGVLEGYDSLEELKRKVRAETQQRLESEARQQYEEKVLEALRATAKVEYPLVLVEHEVEHLLSDQEERLRGMGVSLAQYLQDTGKTQDDLKGEYRETAQDRVVTSLLVARVTEAEKVEVGEMEVEAEAERLVGTAPESQREDARRLFDNPEAREAMRRRLLTHKTIALLVQVARGEAPEKAEETFPAAPESEAEGETEGEETRQ
ncbi:MAG: trigger factor [Chloroflexi bacterium]|nr:trigger factor [Chloroflexota bacterium]